MQTLFNHAWEDPRVLFTLRASRRGRSEARGWESCCSVDARTSKIGVMSPPKSVPEAPGSIKNRFQKHSEQQVELPWSIWAPILTVGELILVLLDLLLELMGFILAPQETISGTPGLHFEGPRAPHGSI